MQKVALKILFILSLAISQQLDAQQNLDREIATIINPLIASIQSQSIKNVAIADFSLLDGTPTELGRYLAEEFSFSLVNAPNRSFVLIDRSRVSALLKENGMASTGMIDPNTIAKLGKMKGIDAVIAGTLTSTGNALRLIVKVWNLETQGLVAASKGDISKTPMIMELEGKVVSSPSSPGPISTTPQSGPPISTYTRSDLKVELLSCSQRGQNLECKFKMVSVGKDLDFSMYAGNKDSRVIVSSGNEYLLSETQLGDKHNGRGWNVKSLVSNVPIYGTLIFAGATEKVSLISKMELGSKTNPGPYFNMEFRDIKVK